MADMTDTIREEVRIAMVRQRVSQTDLAKKTGLSRQHVNNLLTGQRGALPQGWERLFNALGLELTLQPKESRQSDS